VAVGAHAVLWDNGTVTDLGNLGGTSNPAVLGVANNALGIPPAEQSLRYQVPRQKRLHTAAEFSDDAVIQQVQGRIGRDKRVKGRWPYRSSKPPPWRSCPSAQVGMIHSRGGSGLAPETIQRLRIALVAGRLPPDLRV
jgi:hypothetical protein